MTTQQFSAPSATKRRVLLVDDSASLREGLAEVINHQPDLEVCGEAENTGRALELIDRLMPDLAIVDIALADENGIDLIRDIKRRHPEVQVVVLTVHDEALYANEAASAGARGYIRKEEPMATVLGVIRRVLAGGTDLRP